MTQNKRLTILTNDPSITAWGWAVIRNGYILDSGCIKTAPENKKRRIRKSDDTSRRASEIVQIILKLIKHHEVDYILTEAPHGSQNANAAMMIGLVCGINVTIAECLEIGIEFYSEADSKKCALGKISATKGEMVEAMMKIYGDLWVHGIKYIDEAIADALAVYNVASKNSPTIKLLKK
jgi:Holliday junction resolvasome RuvABC endonuclease subunit